MRPKTFATLACPPRSELSKRKPKDRLRPCHPRKAARRKTAPHSRLGRPRRPRGLGSLGEGTSARLICPSPSRSRSLRETPPRAHALCSSHGGPATNSTAAAAVAAALSACPTTWHDRTRSRTPRAGSAAAAARSAADGAGAPGRATVAVRTKQPIRTR